MQTCNGNRMQQLTVNALKEINAIKAFYEFNAVIAFNEINAVNGT